MRNERLHLAQTFCVGDGEDREAARAAGIDMGIVEEEAAAAAAAAATAAAVAAAIGGPMDPIGLTR